MTLLTTLHWVAGTAVIAGGVLLFVIAAIGLIRFPDAYSRLTAVTKSGTLGICLVLLGVLVLEPSISNGIKLLLAVALQLMTSPVGGFALGRAAFRSDSPLPPSLQYDELHDRDERRERGDRDERSDRDEPSGRDERDERDGRSAGAPSPP